MSVSFSDRGKSKLNKANSSKKTIKFKKFLSYILFNINKIRILANFEKYKSTSAKTRKMHKSLEELILFLSISDDNAPKASYISGFTLWL